MHELCCCHWQSGMMPESHWQGYVKNVEGYLQSPGMSEFWADVGQAFSSDFSNWIDQQLAQRESHTSRTAG